MANDSPRDPAAVFREFVTQWERNINTLANQVMGTESFSRLMQEGQRLQLAMQQATSEAMGRRLAAMNMPTRDDVIRLAEKLADVDRRLARIEASLDELLERADAVAIGPGLGMDAEARRIVDHVVLRVHKSKVVDADAISHFAGRAEVLRGAPGEVVLTPHSGEMARIVGGTAAEVEADRFGTLARAVALTGSVVLLKGHRTLVGAPEERVAINVTGSNVLATGGSGDVLTGVLAALGVHLDGRRAAYSAAYVHGVAGERRALHGVDRGVLASEIADEVPFALGALR